MRRSIRLQGCPPVVDGINNRIINYYVAAPYREAKIGEFVEKFYGRALPAMSFEWMMMFSSLVFK